jgi:hypothetical protein
MKLIYLTLIAFLFAGCNSNAIEISGTASNMDNAMVSVLDEHFNNIETTTIQKGKFKLPAFALQEIGYYTFSVQAGKYPRDFEIYLEPGDYDITIPTKETEYLNIKTNSKTQNDISAYYHFENNLIAKYRNEVVKWERKLNDPQDQTVLDSGITYAMQKIDAARSRADGSHIAALSMFIDKYPQNETMPHIIGNMQYKDNPMPYYIVYQKLSPTIKNSAEGKKIGAELQQLSKL